MIPGPCARPLPYVVDPHDVGRRIDRERGAEPCLGRRFEVTSSPRVAAQPAHSGFVVQPGIADPSCNGGRGVRLPAGLSGDAVVVSGPMKDGSTLIAFSSV